VLRSRLGQRNSRQRKTFVTERARGTVPSLRGPPAPVCREEAPRERASRHPCGLQQAAGSSKFSCSSALGAGAGSAPLSPSLVPSPGMAAGPMGTGEPEPGVDPRRMAPAPLALLGTHPVVGGSCPKCRPRQGPVGAGSGVCRAPSCWGWFALVQLQFSPAPPAPGLSVSDGERRGLLPAMKTAPCPCQPAMPQLPPAPRTLPAGTAAGTPSSGRRREGTWGSGRAGLIPLGGGKGKVWRWRGLRDGFQSPSPPLPLLCSRNKLKALPPGN